MIEPGEAHEIRATGDPPLSTVHFHSPATCADNGDPLPECEA
ncbi:hypothetical protein ABNK63_14800 [Rhodanobacter sp. IGA1.0]|uniref:Cupin domain-containing protein n=1 Tax=Rhodanobacter sp. IGA1.0 TaxID=3158582 RepID=A0AAU7QJB7_9GAMM